MERMEHYNYKQKSSNQYLRLFGNKKGLRIFLELANNKRIEAIEA